MACSATVPHLCLEPRVRVCCLQAWFADNEFWLVPYAAFCFLRDLFGTAEHWRWGTMSTPTQQVCVRTFVLGTGV